jgi:hypothetical protein
MESVDEMRHNNKTAPPAPSDRSSVFFLNNLPGMHLTQPMPTNCICSPQLDEFYQQYVVAVE